MGTFCLGLARLGFHGCMGCEICARHASTWAAVGGASLAVVVQGVWVWCETPGPSASLEVLPAAVP